MKAEKRILLSVPHMGGAERGYVESAFASNWLSTIGPNLTELEQRFTGLTGKPSVALGSGTAGIHLGLKLLGVKAGDEVVTPTLTFAASCNPILYEHAIPVFMDCEPDSWNLDPELLSRFLSQRSKVNRLPKAVTVVHLFGQTADMDPILEVCARYEIPILEDAASTLGAFYKGRVPGTMGEVGIYSFSGNKIITCTGGGMLVAQRKEWVDQARFWSAQARDADPQGLNNYVHSQLGYNYRLSNVLAGIALGQLEVLETRVQQRRAVFERYRLGFEGIDGIEPQEEMMWEGVRKGSQVQECEPRKRGRKGTEGEAESETGPSPQPSPIRWAREVIGNLLGHGASRHTRWLSCFTIDEAKFGMSAGDLIRYLEACNVEARPVWRPMHVQPLYFGYECVGGTVAEEVNRRGICLPSSSSLSAEDQEFVIEAVKRGRK